MVSEKYGRAIRDPFDLEPEEEQLISRLFAEEYGSEFVFITHYPSKKRPFYAADDPEDPRYTLSFDLLFRGLEVTTGGQRIHNYREQVEKMELAVKQLESVKDQFTRLNAEYDNYRKRTTKEKDGIYQDAKGDTIKTFLAVYDNLERAAAAEGGEDDPHKKGLEMIFHQFKELLAKEGVKEIEAKGKEFNPELMNAVMHIEDESLGENVVAQVFQAGFELNGKVLRHAIVQVAN